MKSQIESIKKNEKTHNNIPDPVFSNDGGEGSTRHFDIIYSSFVRKENKQGENILQPQQRQTNLFLT